PCPRRAAQRTPGGRPRRPENGQESPLPVDGGPGGPGRRRPGSGGNPVIPRFVKSGLARALDATGAAELLGAARGVRRLPLILGYHRVVEDFAAAARRSIPSQ